MFEENSHSVKLPKVMQMDAKKRKGGKNMQKNHQNLQKHKVWNFYDFAWFFYFPFLARVPFGEHHLAAFRFKEIDHGESIGARNFRKSRKMRDEMGVQGNAQ